MTIRFWHIVKDREGLIREQYIYSSSTKKLSLECLEIILNGTYEVIATDTNY